MDGRGPFESHLLTNEDKSSLMRLLNKNHDIMVSAVAQLLVPKTNKWEKYSTGVICLVNARKGSNAKRTQMAFCDIKRQKIFLNTQLTLDMDYKMTDMTFHTFKWKCSQIGISFADQNEAFIFGKSITGIQIQRLEQISRFGRIPNTAFVEFCQTVGLNDNVFEDQSTLELLFELNAKYGEKYQLNLTAKTNDEKSGKQVIEAPKTKPKLLPKPTPILRSLPKTTRPPISPPLPRSPPKEGSEPKSEHGPTTAAIPPPPSPFSGKSATKESANLMSQMKDKKFKPMKRSDSQKTSREALLEDIKKGRALKKVSQQDKEKKTPKDSKSGLMSELEKKIVQRRQQTPDSDSDDDSDEDDDKWKE